VKNKEKFCMNNTSSGGKIRMRIFSNKNSKEKKCIKMIEAINFEFIFHEQRHQSMRKDIKI
jgi:hypothetical protein